MVIDGLSYTKEEAKTHLKGAVEEAIFPKLMRDIDYRNDWAKAQGFKSYNEFLDTSFLPELDRIEKEIVANNRELYKGTVGSTSLNTNVAVGAMLAESLSNEADGLKAIRDIRDQVEAMKDGSFWNGVNEGGDLYNAMTFGISGLVSDVELYRTLNKAYSGQELTPREKNIKALYEIQQTVNEFDQLAGKTLSREIGGATGTTLEVMPQFVSVMGIAGKVANLGKVGVRTGVNLTKRAYRQGVAKGIVEGLKQTGRIGKNVGLNIAKANFGGLVVAPLQAGTYSRYIENRTNQFSFKDGKLIYTPNEAWKDAYTAIVDSVNEVSSEVLGAGIGNMMGLTFKSVGKVFGLDKVVNGVSSKIGLGASYDKLFGIKKSATFRAFEKSLGYSGNPVAEAMSEIYGDISANIMKMGIADAQGESYSNFSMLADPTYWKTNLALAGILGLSSTMTQQAANIGTYRDLYKLGNLKYRSIRSIESRKLSDALRMMGVDTDLNASAQRLANLGWTNVSQKDVAHAMDYIRAEAMQQTALGVDEQNKDLARFNNVAIDIQQRAYKGEKGDILTQGFIEAILKDGSKVNVISGNIKENAGAIVEVTLEDGTKVNVDSEAKEAENESDLLMVMDEKGEVKPIAKSKVTITNRTTTSDKMAWEYKGMFGTQELIFEVIKDINTFETLEEPTQDNVNEIMSKMGIAQPEMHEEVTLVDGRKGLFAGWGTEGVMYVEAQAETGEIEFLSVPFYKVLSSSSHYAEAQKLMFGEDMVDAAKEELIKEEVKDTITEGAPESATIDVTPQPTAETTTKNSMGAIVDTPQGKARIVAIEDGKYIVDYALNNVSNDSTLQELDEYAIEELDGGISADVAAVTEEVSEATPEAIKEVQNAVAGIKSIPTKEDGSVNYEAIDDPKLYAETFAHEMGDKAEAAEAVANMRANVLEEVEALEKKRKKSTSASETIANKKAIDGAKQRVAFFDAVLNEFTPKEAMAKTPASEAAESVVAEAPNVETPAHTTEKVAEKPREQADEAKVPARKQEAGIIDNEHAKSVNEDIRKVVDRFAKALGVTVEFQPKVVDGGKVVNGKIENGHIVLATKVKTKTLDWLMGHEFLHRMKTLAPEQYEKFVQSVKDHLGEAVWNERMEAQKKRYIANGMLEESEDIDLMTEECVADFMGDMAQNHHAFDEYLDTIEEDRPVINAIKRVLKYIADLFNGENRRINAMLKQVDALIAAAEKAQAEGVKAESKKRDSVMDAPSLVGVHNISLDKLRKAIKMGGLANPSVAVIDVDKQTHDDYGQYSLVLPKNMVDARQGKNAGTWAGDAWTPTYPPIIKRMRDSKAMRQFYKDIESLPEDIRNRVRLDFDSFMEGRSANALAYWYLFEKGNAPALVYIPSRYSEDITNAVEEATNGSFSMYGLTSEERAKCLDAYIAVKFNGDRAAFEEEMQARIDRLTETIETKKSDRVKKWAQDTIDSIKEYGFDYDDVAKFIKDVEYDAREKGMVNVDATITAAREQIKTNSLNSDYDAWRDNLDERYGIEEYIFDGYTNSGNRRYLLHTVDNASKWMKKQGRQGAVATFPSFGTFVAVSVPKMTTLESIRKRKALLGKSKEEYDAFREKWENVYYELGTKLQPDAKSFDDYGYWRLIEAVGHDNPKEFIKKEYGIELSEEDMAKLDEMLNAIRTEYPARYFETKFERPLQLSDFTAAVVPNDIPLDVESRLKDAGVEVIEYEKGDNASRAEAMQKASAKDNVRFSLIGEIGASALDMAEEATFRMDNLAIARQMEERGDSALDIRMATGWERGADGLWRYELMDAEVNLYDGNEATIRKKIEVAEEEEKDFMQQSKTDTKELRERTNTYLAEMREKYGVAEGEETDAMTEEEIAHLQSLTGKEIAFEDYKERRRSELYNRRMALEAQLGYVKVKNTDTDAMIQTTRLGHIIQGKNADALFTAYPSLRDMEVQFVTDIRDGAFAAYATKGGYKRIELNAKKTPVDMLTYYLMHEVQHAIQDVEGFAGGGNLSSLQNNGEVTAKEAYDYYRKIAGEVEARNVSARINMSAEERMNTLLSETEDVAREDQIFIREGVEMAMAEESVYSSLQETNDRFNAELAMQISGTLPKGHIYKLGMPSYILRDAGIPNLPIELAASRLVDKSMQENHPFDLDEVKDLPFAIHLPLAVFRSATHIGSNVILTELKHNGKSFVVAIETNRQAGKLFVNSIRSVHYRTDMNIINWINDGLADYIKPTFEQEWLVPTKNKLLSQPQYNSVDVRKKLNDVTNVIQNFENPKVSEKFSLITPEMDADYLSAVERGDIATAQQMVMEAAKLAGYVSPTDYQGSLAFNGAAPMANDYFETKEERKEAWNNGDYEGTMSLGDYADNAIDTNDLEWQLTDKGNYRRAEDYTKESIDNINESIKNGTHKIVIYRAVPNAVEENAVRNGDWVTPSRKYAEYHIGLQDWEGGRVIEQEVDIDNIWWNGDDINEWGYDDGSNYGYRNTPNNRKLLDPVTYDDNGNVIPLSERFNPKKEDIRYSLSDRPTGLLTDFAEEFEALQKMYESIDPTTIHAQHPFRMQKRKVVQKYLSHVTEVLGLPCEVFVLDSDNEQQMRRVYEKYATARPANGDVIPYEEFKAELGDSIGEYLHDTNMVVVNINSLDSVNANSEYLGVVIHENAHKIIEGMGVSEKMLEAIYKEAQRLAPEQAKIIDRRYPDAPVYERGEEHITFSLQTRATYKERKGLLMQFFEGSASVDDVLKSFKISLPLRDEILKNILIALRDGYNNKYNDQYTNNNGGANDLNREAKEEASGNGRRSKHLGYTRGDILDNTRYSLMDMPFFEDGGDVVVFDDIAEEPMRDTRPRVTEDTLRSYMDGRHYAATQRIRKEASDAKAVARLRLQEERRRRSEGIASQRTNVGKVDYILGDTPRESLDYYNQALVMIAEGGVKIMWEDGANNRRGLASELGYRTGEKKAYKQITSGATQSLEGFVHSWWESLGGYENGIDTQDLRNALIEALQDAPKASTAISLLREKYDSPQREYDNAVADIEAHMDRELSLEDARYNEEVAEFEGGADKAKLIRYYEQNAVFHDDITSIKYTIRDLERKLERATRNASRAQVRGENNVEALRNLRQGIADAKEAITQAVRESKVLKYNSREVQSIIDGLESARSANALKIVLGRVENMLLNIRIREERNNMQRLLNMRLPNGQLVETWVGEQIREGRMTAAEGKRIISDMWRGVNSKGVKVAKFVDAHTAAVMTFLRDRLVLPIAKKGVVVTENADGTKKKSFKPEREAIESTDALRTANVVARTEIINKVTNEGRQFTEQEKVELDARELYEHYLSVVASKMALKENAKSIEDIKNQIGAIDAERLDVTHSGMPLEELNVTRNSFTMQLSSVYDARREIKRNYEAQLMQFNERIGNILANGRDALKAFREGKEQHRQEIIRLGIKAIGGRKARKDPLEPTVKEKLEAKFRGSVHDTYWTFETACREIDRWSPNGEGAFFNHFMGGYTEASNGFASRQVAHYQTLGEVIHRLWPEYKRKSAYNAFTEIMRKADTHVVGVLQYNTAIDAEGTTYHPERTEMRISNAMFAIAMWRQSQYQATMARYGITQRHIDELEVAIKRIDPRYIKFMDYINDVFLPDTRLEYDEVHKKMFGASMDNIENYFPAKVSRAIEEADIANQVDGALPSTMTRSIISRKPHGAQPDYTQSYFGMLLSHIQDMDRWASFAPLIEDMNTILSNVEFKKRLNEHMSGVERDRTGKGSLYQIFRTRCALATDCYTPKSTIADELLRNATRYWAASNIAWRMSTALKQLSAAPIFAAYSTNLKCLAIWMKNIVAGVVPMMGLFEWATENSPSFRQRWATKNAGNEKLSQRMREIAHGVESRTKVGNVMSSVSDFLHKLATEWGITPNAAVDAWVCATGMKTIYEFEISKATKGQREATEEEKKAAMRKAEIFMNTTQQSAESAYLSEVQMQKSLITTALTNYMNASYALHRLRVGGTQELWRGWFDAKYRRAIIDEYGREALKESNKKAVARILQGVIGDVGFWLAGIGLRSMWALIAGVDDDEDEKEKDFSDMSTWQKIAYITKLPAQLSLNGFLGGNMVSNVLQGYDSSVTTAWDALLKSVDDFIDFSINEETGELEWAFDWWAGLSLVTKFGFGVDTRTTLNITQGIAEIDSAEGIMKIFNEPRSSINFVAGRRREGETVKQYIERRMHLEIIGSEPSFEDMFDEDGKYIGKGKVNKLFGLTDKQIKGFLKEYKERQARAVLTPHAIEKHAEIDSKYKEVCEKMGWKPEITPNNSLVDKSKDTSKKQNKKNRWIYPDGLSQRQYAKLKEVATEAAAKCREVNRFIGTDKGFKSLLDEEYNMKSNVIKTYNEL